MGLVVTVMDVTWVQRDINLHVISKTDWVDREVACRGVLLPCHELVIRLVWVTENVYCVCMFECITSSVAAGVKVAQAVNSTHSSIPSHFLSKSFIFLFFFFSDLVLHWFALLICIGSWHPHTSHKQPPNTHTHPLK